MSTVISFESTESLPLPIYRFTVEQYQRMGESGVLAPEDSVELLEGWIVQKLDKRPLHGYLVRWLNGWLQANLPSDWLMQCQLPITTERSEPEPDLVVVRGKHSDYRERHPSGGDCRLVIEVADTSLAKDRAKISIYAAAGVQEYWIVNAIDNQIESFRDSDGTLYRQHQVWGLPETIQTDVGGTLLSLPLAQLFES
ncbi:Uma2 family endonuclease [Rosistilla oblonga]|uniref:Uma2 family endonuclease n=1 Tax=Rosistilla oblonga TaxID=2527990 RepID=UPI003A977346